MCIVAFAWKAHPRWKMVAIGNRDELHARPAESLHRWETYDHLLAGRDAIAGGTWLGVSEEGRFAVVTNLYGFGAPQPERASRGDLLRDFLAGHGRYADLASTQYADFNPFNLITVEGDQAIIHSSRPRQESIVLEPGVHGLSNGPVDSPWPKSPHLNAQLDAWLAADRDHPEQLLDSLSDPRTFEPETVSSPPGPTELEPQHSAIFIRNPAYGTRCSTVVAIDQAGGGMILERRFAPSGEAIGESKLSFSWPNST
ncbi:NRDE family protein [Parasphingorhabdus sp.]|uniref:NRDE family protein n=1 Tax=Parasphingorhabdus sp. TaxID=2709688 RepID=UPI003D2CCC06